MIDKNETQVDFSGASIHVREADGEEVTVGPGGVHVKDGESEVHVSWTGVRIQDGKTHLNVSFWKPLLGCAVISILLVAALTAVVVSVVKLLI